MNNRIYYSKEAEMEAQREKMAAVLVFMAFGLSIGAILALLFAPKSGEQTRGDIGNVVEDRFGNVEKEVTSRFSRVEKDLAELGKRVEDRLNDIRK